MLLLLSIFSFNRTTFAELNPQSIFSGIAAAGGTQFLSPKQQC